MDSDIDKLVSLAKEGDRDALETLVKSIQDRIYKLALKMLYQPPDAEDATQEILIKVITKLGSFRRESAFATWAFTIAVNHLKNRQQNQKEKWFTFKRCEKLILKKIPDQSSIGLKAEQALVVEEMRIICMQGLLQCLDRDHRLAYILGVTMDLSGPEGAAILEITPSAFRKRLSRARESLRNFFNKNCDLFDHKNPCNCTSQAILAVNKGNIEPKRLWFTRQPVSVPLIPDVQTHLARLDRSAREVVLMRMNQDYKAPETFLQEIKQILHPIIIF